MNEALAILGILAFGIAAAGAVYLAVISWLEIFGDDE